MELPPGEARRANMTFRAPNPTRCTPDRDRGGSGGLSRRRRPLPFHLLPLLLLPLLLPCDAARGADAAFTPPEGERALVRYMAEVDGREFDVRADPAPLLEKAVLGRAKLKGSDFPGIRYIVHADGKVEPYTLDAYVAAMREEGVGVATEKGGREG